MMRLRGATMFGMAELLDRADAEGLYVTQITHWFPDLELRDAYEIQRRIRRLRESRGGRVVGYKVELVRGAGQSEASRPTPIYGLLFEGSVCSDGESIDPNELLRPMVEPEIAFVTKTALGGPGCDIEQVLAGTAWVAPALEVTDSRYRTFPPDLASMVADNCSAGRVLLGQKRPPPSDFDLRTLAVMMTINGEVVGIGSAAEILGHPASSVSLLADFLSDSREIIPAGSIVLSGALSRAVPVKRGDVVVARFEMLGPVSTEFASRFAPGRLDQRNKNVRGSNRFQVVSRKEVAGR